MKPTLEDIRRENGLTIEQIIREAHISRPVWNRMASGQPVRNDSAIKVVRAINQLLGTTYTLESVEVIVYE